MFGWSCYFMHANIFISIQRTVFHFSIFLTKFGLGASWFSPLLLPIFSLFLAMPHRHVSNLIFPLLLSVTFPSSHIPFVFLSRSHICRVQRKSWVTESWTCAQSYQGLKMHEILDKLVPQMYQAQGRWEHSLLESEYGCLWTIDQCVQRLATAASSS